MRAFLAWYCALLPAGLEMSVTAAATIVSFRAGSRLTRKRSCRPSPALLLHVAEQRVADGHADDPEEYGYGDADRQVVPKEPLLQGHHVQDPRGVSGAAAGGAVDGV